MIFKSKLEGISKYKLKDTLENIKAHNIDIMKMVKRFKNNYMTTFYV